MHSITIAGRRIAADLPPYVVAELSANHNGSIETAKKIIDAAKLAGADAIKVQTYRPDYVTPLRGPNIVLLDTGAALGADGRLSAVCAETGETLQVHRSGKTVEAA